MTVLCLLMLLSGCQSMQFYSQAIVGQSKLLWQRQSVSELLAAEDLEPALRYRLELATAILDFARAEGLDPSGVYESYAETGRQFVVWNVFAAEPFRLSLIESCFPVAGCVTYRGYFEKADAERYAAELQAEGYDVYIGGVPAYSTLGWFDDPLLDTFLFFPEERLAALIFHELAHQLVYVKDDTRFNESVATAVEQVMLQKWLQAQHAEDRYANYEAARVRRQAVLDLINQTREELRALYASRLAPARMQQKKEAIIAQLVERYREMADSWQTGEEFRGWMNAPINNAKLETVADYNTWAPVLSTMLRDLGLPAFRAEMVRLSAMTVEAREDYLLNQSR